VDVATGMQGGGEGAHYTHLLFGRFQQSLHFSQGPCHVHFGFVLDVLGSTAEANCGQGFRLVEAVRAGQRGKVHRTGRRQSERSKTGRASTCESCVVGVARRERETKKSWSKLWVRQVVWKNFVHRGTHTRKMVIYFNKIISRANSCHARPLPLPLLSPRTGLEPNQDSHVL
jgi:hypothetical protein